MFAVQNSGEDVENSPTAQILTRRKVPTARVQDPRYMKISGQQHWQQRYF